ncbi:MAG: 1,4-dihydroxy-2-naphthoate octaprenyltransferase [Bacteroidales bacterium]|nr:1,4-dihydroxy-2-naphthoate octaprenyltransferase [Bacteroidales bacterium]
MKQLKCWIEAMRLRTLPVSVAGVLTAWAWALIDGRFDAMPAVLCLAFALLAQIASNFANEYYDYTAGRDRVGREGPRRGVTEGDITPAAMRKATLVTIGIAGCVGLSLVAWGGWWLLAVGALIAVGVFAYSTGPYPLSTHGWGEVAVVFFFGIIPVNLTYYLAAGCWSSEVLLSSVAIGLMGANVLIINNYRDREDDLSVGKRTLCVRWGRRCMARIYLADIIIASLLLTVAVIMAGRYESLVAVVVYLLLGLKLRALMVRRLGAQLNPLLGGTALSMFAVAVILLVCAAVL